MKLVTFEGIDGSGKTHQLLLTAEWLRSLGHNVLSLKAPYNSYLRELIMDSQDIHTKALLFLADLNDLTVRNINPLLSDDKPGYVLLDRYYDSFRAYQIHAQNLKEYTDLYKMFYTTKPDLTLWIDTDPEIAVERVIGRGGEEVEDKELLKLSFRVICEGYKQIDNSLVCRINGDHDIETVQTKVRAAFKGAFNEQ